MNGPDRPLGSKQSQLQLRGVRLPTRSQSGSRARYQYGTGDGPEIRLTDERTKPGQRGL
jgi:hypothetical protein